MLGHILVGLLVVGFCVVFGLAALAQPEPKAKAHSRRKAAVMPSEELRRMREAGL